MMTSQLNSGQRSASADSEDLEASPEIAAKLYDLLTELDPSS